MAEPILTVVRGSQLLPLIWHLRDSEIDPAGLLKRCYCPVNTDFDSPNCCVPTKRFWQLIEETAWLLKDPQTCWLVAERYGLQGSRYLGYQLENQPPAASVPAPRAALPFNADMVTKGGVTYYQCGKDFYIQAYGSNGPVYMSVPAP